MKFLVVFIIVLIVSKQYVVDMNKNKGFFKILTYLFYLIIFISLINMSVLFLK